MEEKIEKKTAITNSVPKTKKTVKKTKKTSSKKKVVKKKVTKKKTVKKVKKATKKKQTTKKVLPEENYLNNLTDKFSSFFDNLIDDIKQLPKKTTEISKNSHVIDSITTMVKTAKKETSQWTKDHVEQIKLNNAIATKESKLVDKYLLLGKKTFEKSSSLTIDNQTIKNLIKEITDLKEQIKTEQKKLNKLLKNS